MSRDVGAFNSMISCGRSRASSRRLRPSTTAPAFAAALRGPLGLATGETTASVEAEMLGGDIGRRRRQAWARASTTGKTNDREFAAKLREVDGDGALEARIGALLDAFFIEGGEGEPRTRASTTKTSAAKIPDLEADLRREQDRLIALRDRRLAALTVERSEALFAVGKAVLTAFSKAKAGRGELDFADQIARRAQVGDALERRLGAPQARRQARSPADRRGAGHLARAMAHPCRSERRSFSPDGGREGLSADHFRRWRREAVDLFLSGGRAGELFAEMRRFFERRHREAELRFESVPLNFSFRSAPAILEAVDKTFGSEEAWRGVGAAGEPPPDIEAVRSAHEGLVELWPTIKPAPAARPGRLAHAARRVVARRSGGDARAPIAETIGEWLSPESRERVVGPRRRAATHSSGRRNDPGSQPQRLLRCDDPRAEGRESESGRRRPADAARSYCGDGPCRRWSGDARAGRRSDPRLRPQVAACRARGG